MSIDTPPITSQQYELLHGGGAEAAERARQHLSRRRFLRRSLLAVLGVSTTASVGGALAMLYPNLSGQFGSAMHIGNKADFPAARPEKFILNQAGVFYHPVAKSYIVHMSKDTTFLLNGAKFHDQIETETWFQDKDGSYWVVLYQRCVHLGCTVPFRNDCMSFKCPCHGSHYQVNGEYLDGPAPRSLDRFMFSFQGDTLMIDTGTLNNKVPHPDNSTRLLPIPTVQCSV